MQFVAHPDFAAETRRFALRCACEDCTYFIDEHGTCANGYPNAVHRAGAFEEGSRRIGTFCKEFELR